MAKKLYLIPSPLSEEASFDPIPLYVRDIVQSIRFFIVEDEKRARRFLKKLNAQFPFPECQMVPLNEHTKRREF